VAWQNIKGINKYGDHNRVFPVLVFSLSYRRGFTKFSNSSLVFVCGLLMCVKQSCTDLGIMWHEAVTWH